MQRIVFDGHRLVVQNAFAGQVCSKLEKE